MFTVSITEKGGQTSIREFDKPEISIGRVQGNDIVLPKSNISKRHARIVSKNGAFLVIDTKSTNGTYVNGKRLSAPHNIVAEDKIFVGDFTLQVHIAEAQAAAKPQKPAAEAESNESATNGAWREDDAESWSGDWGDELAEADLIDEASGTPDAIEPAKSPPKPMAQAKTAAGSNTGANASPMVPLAGPAAALTYIHRQLSSGLKLRELGRLGTEEIHQHTAEAVRQVVKTIAAAGAMPAGMDAKSLTRAALSEAVGYGPIDGLMQDDTVTEIFINHPKQVYVRRDGNIEETDVTFSSEAAVAGLVRRIVVPRGFELNEDRPIVEAMLPGGPRIHAIFPPLSVKGPTVVIRKGVKEPLQLDGLVSGGSLNEGMADFLAICVKARRNILVVGGRGAGKTTLINALTHHLPASERVITVEYTAELNIEHDHVLNLEARSPHVDGAGEVTTRALLQHALRLQSDRIILGEIRGAEGFDAIQAMATGSEGMIASLHADTAQGALVRLQTLASLGGPEVPVRTLRELIATGVQVVVQINRLPDGSRRILRIAEIAGVDASGVAIGDIFVFERVGQGKKRTIRYRPTGTVPRFYRTLKALGIQADADIFTPPPS